ncbi:YraN family protein [Kitasatospora sp. NPDC051853]|uniref:YraN family protein n=1 Tax=Kitasatospora sp. NPDC051853 TaxID=3364058 RepID=UPI00379E2092
MQSSNTGLGRYGEEVAARWLTQGGLQILERNWRCAEGELDIVALDGDTLAVCEVKTRSERGFQQPQEGIDQTKAERLRHLAERWLGERWPEHFDRLARAVEAASGSSDGPSAGQPAGAPPSGAGAEGGAGEAESPGTGARTGSGKATGGKTGSTKGGRAKAVKGGSQAAGPEQSIRSVPLPPGGVRIDLVAVVNRLKGAALVEHLRGAV